MILQPLRGSPTDTFTDWIDEVRSRAGCTPPPSGLGANLAVRLLNQKGLRVSRVEYEAARIEVLAEVVDSGLQELFEGFCAELMALTPEEPGRVAVTELRRIPLDGLLLRAPGGSGRDYLIALHPSFPTFANLLAKSLALALPLEETNQGYRVALKGDWTSGIGPGSPAVSRFMEVFEATARLNPGQAPHYLAPPDRAAIVGGLRNAMERFVIARYLASILLGKANRMPYRIVPGIEVEVCVDPICEREASVALGAAFMLRTSTLQDSPLAYWAVETLLWTLNLLRTVGETRESKRLTTFLGFEIEEPMMVCRRALTAVRGEDSQELLLSEALEPVRHAFLAAVERWVASAPVLQA